MKRTRFKQAKLFSLAVCSALAVAACSAAPQSAAPTAAPAAPAAAAPADPMAKYDPPITLSTILIVDDTIKYKDGDTHDNNAYTRAYREELGIQLEYKWTVAQTQASEKINVLIATNDLPDIMRVDMKQLQRLVESKGQPIVELAGVLENYATAFTKGIRPLSDAAFKSATFGGRLMALPHNATTGLDRTNVLWMRKDWLEKLGLAAPTTVDELAAVAEAFVRQDPDGNGQQDTYGIAATKNLLDTFAGLDGLFAAYHTYPGSWIAGGDGTLVYGSVQPEMKAALLKLQEFFAKGYFDPEFGTKDGGKVAEYTSAGRIGIEMGMMWNSAWPLNASRDNDENAEWAAYPIVAADAAQPKSVVDVPVQDYVVVSKDCAYPEALVKMLNFFYDKVYGPQADPLVYWETADGVQTFKYASIMSEKLYQNLDMHLHCVEAVETGDTSKLSAMEKVNYEKIMNVLNGSRLSGEWSMYALYGAQGSFAVLKDYEAQGAYFYNGFYGAPTETMATKGSNLVKSVTAEGTMLSKMENEVFTKIIMGAPIETFDTFAADWARLGGDQITQEVNAWYSELQ